MTLLSGEMGSVIRIFLTFLFECILSVMIGTLLVTILQHTLMQEPLSAKDERLILRARYRLISYRRDIAQLSVPLLQKVGYVLFDWC